MRINPHHTFIAHSEAERNAIAYASFGRFVAHFPQQILRSVLYQYTTYMQLRWIKFRAYVNICTLHSAATNADFCA